MADAAVEQAVRWMVGEGAELRLELVAHCCQSIPIEGQLVIHYAL
jgi:hypothetical protein